MFRVAVLTVLVPALLVGCVRHLPPPTPPERTLPAIVLPSDPPAPNHGRVVLDSPASPAGVEVIESRMEVEGRVGVQTRRLCGTPCAADLPLGQHELRFTEENGGQKHVITVDVAATNTAVRVALGKKPGSTFVPGLGIGLAALGGISLGVLANGWANGDTSGEENLTILSVGALAVGLRSGTGAARSSRTPP